ncbi:RodZ domain-containing protein [Nocardioides pacificus]
MSAAQARDHRPSNRSDRVFVPEPLVAVDGRPHSDSDDVTDQTPVLGHGEAPAIVEVRRNAGVSALVGATASAVAIAYLGRAAQTGAWLDWALVALMGALGSVHLWNLVDSRTPLLVADAHGVRIRLGRTWRGLPWGALDRVEHSPRRGILRDGRLALVARNPERFLGELDAAGRRQTRVATRLHGAPFAVPLGLATRVVGADGDLTVALERLAGASVNVVELVPEVVVPDSDDTADERSAEEWSAVEAESTEELPEDLDVEDGDAPLPRWRRVGPVVAHGITLVASRLPKLPARTDSEVEYDDEPSDEPAEAAAVDDVQETSPLTASATPAPLRETRSGARAEIRHEVATSTAAELPEARELRRNGSVNLVEETQVWGDRVRPIATGGDSVEPLVIDDFAVEPAADPVIGPELCAARTRLSLSVDQLAERTRIRPHVIESIEVDDFAPCGGDFYARGHLRTLARVLGVDVTPLLATYDERYADAPINARRVFEAELATGAHGSIRGTRGGPNWSVLIAAIMVVVLAWSIARLVMDTPVELQQAPGLNGSIGSVEGTGPASVPAVPVVLRATKGGAHLKVTGAGGAIVWENDLAMGESKRLRVAPPVRIEASDAGAISVLVDGERRGTLGKPGQSGEGVFVVRP